MGKIIFIADDDPNMVGLYDKVFKLYGYDVVMAYDGEQAVEKLEAMTDKPTLLFLDIMMPKRDGFEVLKHIKKNDKFKGIPVVFLTNLSSPEGEQKAVEMGIDMYILKSSYTPKEVMEKVKELLKDRGLEK